MLTKNKRGGFKSFVRRRDGKPEVTPIKTLPVSDVRSVSIGLIQKVLDGYVTYLSTSFSWTSTPQGFTHWSDRCERRRKLTPEDYQWLQELYDYHANR